MGNYLYLVDDYALKVFDISYPSAFVVKNAVQLRFGVETIYTYKDKLFIGARDGMYIYSIANPALPVLSGEATHTRSCDPVVANDSIAFVTLRGNQPCSATEDGLYIYNIKNLLQPILINKKLIPTPNGLGLQDALLYVCQKTNGMSIYDVNNPAIPVSLKTINTHTFEDVIYYGNLLICCVNTGLLIYDVTVGSNPILLSEIN